MVEPAGDGDLFAVQKLLAAHDLPRDGLTDARAVLVARNRTGIVGTVALELYRDGALLRSLAVDRQAQGGGLGQELTQAALDLARRSGVTTVFLLTTTAEHFFPRFGFEVITRADVPDTVLRSVEFQSACPASAVVMRKRLDPRS